MLGEGIIEQHDSDQLSISETASGGVTCRDEENTALKLTTEPCAPG